MCSCRIPKPGQLDLLILKRTIKNQLITAAHVSHLKLRSISNELLMTLSLHLDIPIHLRTTPHTSRILMRMCFECSVDFTREASTLIGALAIEENLSGSIGYSFKADSFSVGLWSSDSVCTKSPRLNPDPSPVGPPQRDSASRAHGTASIFPRRDDGD